VVVCGELIVAFRGWKIGHFLKVYFLGFPFWELDDLCDCPVRGVQRKCSDGRVWRERPHQSLSVKKLTRRNRRTRNEIVLTRMDGKRVTLSLGQGSTIGQ
jgi:hypothetical protein